MLNFYEKHAKYYHNDKEYYTEYHNSIITSEEPKNYVENITWENLEENFRKGKFPYSTWYARKKGKIFSFSDCFDSEHFSTKEWEEPLNIRIEYSFIHVNPSIKRIMDYSDGEKAIQYLVERGLSIVGK